MVCMKRQHLVQKILRLLVLVLAVRGWMCLLAAPRRHNNVRVKFKSPNGRDCSYHQSAATAGDNYSFGPLQCRNASYTQFCICFNYPF